MTWHVPDAALSAYERGTIDSTQQLSVEAHLGACAACRSTLAALVDGESLRRTWDAIVNETSSPPPGVFERMLVACGVADHNARLVAATPTLRRSWLLAVAAVLAAGVLVANAAANGYVFFLTIAPLLPLAGIAAAYGPGIDPAYEIGVAAPMRSFRLLLTRALAVLTSTISLAGVAALFLPGLDWRAAAWLLPSLGLAAACLALTTVVSPLRAAAFVGAVWVLTVAGAAAATPGNVVAQRVFGEQLQIVVVAVGIGSGLVLAARREELERGVRQ